MTTRKVLMVDPPQGWMFGFPKPLKKGLSPGYNALYHWLIEQGYPQKLAVEGARHCRYWEAEVDVPESQCAAHTEAVGSSQVATTPEREMCPVCGLKWFPHEWPNDCITEECPNVSGEKSQG